MILGIKPYRRESEAPLETNLQIAEAVCRIRFVVLIPERTAPLNSHFPEVSNL